MHDSVGLSATQVLPGRKITAESVDDQHVLGCGWDFVGETANGTDDIWWIDEGKDYPRLWWESAEEYNLTADYKIEIQTTKDCF